CWIVQRVFELGFEAKLHGQFDSNHGSHSDRFDNRIERIGKKYQWIAFHQIMAMVADNYKVKEWWSFDSKTKFYEGAWELSLRDIDPVFTSKTKFMDEDMEDELGVISPSTAWWLDIHYDYWNHAGST